MKTGPPDYHVRRSPRAKNLRLKVTRDEGLVVVIPGKYDETKIPALLQKKKVWISDALQRVGETRRFLEPTPQQHLPAFIRLFATGETWLVTYRLDESGYGVCLRVERSSLLISGPDLNRQAIIRKLKDWLRGKVRENLFPLAERLAVKHHLLVGRMLVKSQRTRWASCSAQKNLALNTKLLCLSPDLVRYVIIHELCHTVHMNHGKEFWNLVAAHEPSYKSLDRTLRHAWKTIPQWMF